MLENYKIFQTYEINNELIEEEIASNYSINSQTNFDSNESNELKINLNDLQTNANINSNLKLNECLNDKQYIILKNILTKYSTVFSRDKFDLGSINIEQCKIELTNNVPINLRPYRCSQSDQKIIDEQIKFLLEKKLIRKSVSPYSFPITLADKKDEGKRTRLCIDFRKLNSIVIPDNFPFPRIEDIIDQLHNCRFFSCLDISSGFWHIKVYPRDIHKLAFVTMNEHYEWLVMPFGFRSSPQIFQRIIHTILKKHNLSNFSVNYLDDILIYSKSFDEHISHIENVLKALITENVKLKLSKCSFAQKSVKYLGHIISENKIIPLNDNLKSIKEYPNPKNVKMVQQFLGKVNYYYKFIPNATKLLNPLYKLLSKDTKFLWTDECQKSFDTIKQYLISSPILAIYNPNEECILFTDASKIGLGAVLKQKQSNGKLHPIAYFSKKLLPYQTNYSVSELECLAIVESINFWHHYLYGNKFTVYSDHNCLKWLKSVKKPNSRLFNWSLKLSQYDFEIKYMRGNSNLEADALSRNPIDEKSERSEHLKIVNLLTKNEIIDAQTQAYPSKNSIPKHCKYENDLIIRIKNNFHKILVPENLRSKLIEKFHKIFGHIGTKKMLKLISTCYFWPKMTELISNFVKNCSVCQTNKIIKIKKYGSLSQLGPALQPYDIVSIDTVGGFSGYNSKKQYIHIAIDHFTRYLWTLSSKTQSAKDFINLIKTVNQTNKPKMILADRYTGIKSHEFSSFLEKNDIKLMFITVNCPQSNGLCERVNQTIVTRLRCKLNDNNQNICWPKLLEKVTEEYNNSPHSVTQFTPKYLMFGIKPFDPLINGSDISLEEARKIALIDSEHNHELNKRYYDKNHIKVDLKEGDLVYVENKNEISRRKLEPLMIGPFKILKKLSETSYEVECDKKGRTKDVFHVSKLRFCNPLTKP
jgi:hypothetical protein